MMKEEQNLNTSLNSSNQEQEIDLMAIVLKIWNKRIFILKVCGIAVIVGLIIALSVVKKYTTTVISAPELQTPSTKTSGLNNIASMMGIDLTTTSGTEALSPMIYPQVIKSVPFIVDLFEIPVTSVDGEIHTTYSDYLTNYQKKVWWSYIISAPMDLIGWIVSLFKDNELELNNEINTFQLTQDQFELVESIQKNIELTVNTKEGILTLSVSAQDPRISAILAEEIMEKLQIHITKYRTKKASIDCDFYQNMRDEAKKEYYKAQQEYAVFSDENQNVVLASYKTELERLNNQMQLAFSLYNQVSQQYQSAQMKVQEIKPVYTVIQPASVPLKGSPSRFMILIGCVFLGGVGAIGWIFFKEWMSNLKKNIDD